MKVIPRLLQRIRVMEEEIDAQKLCLSKYEEKNQKLQRRVALMKIENGKKKYWSWFLGLLALLSWILCIFMIVSLMDYNGSGKQLKRLAGNGNQGLVEKIDFVQLGHLYELRSELVGKVDESCTTFVV